MAQTPSTTPLILKVKDNEYTIDRITVGNLMHIEIAKATISRNQYGNILQLRTNWSIYTLDNIDMFAHLTVFCSKLIEDFEVDSWEGLDPFDLQQLKKAYAEQFVPWFKTFSDLLNKVPETKEDEKEGQKSSS